MHVGKKGDSDVANCLRRISCCANSVSIGEYRCFIFGCDLHISLVDCIFGGFAVSRRSSDSSEAVWGYWLYFFFICIFPYACRSFCILPVVDLLNQCPVAYLLYL